MTFDELVSIVSQKFLLDTKQIRQGICPKATDVAYAVHFMDNDLRVQLRVGPLRKDEIEQQFAVNRNTNVPPKRRGLPPEELFSELPNVSLLMDVDVSKNDVKRGDLSKTYEDAKAVQSKLSQNIVSYIFGLEE